MARLVDEYRAFIIDLDGVVYLLDEPIPGAVEVIRHLQERGAPFVFLTNNSAKTPGGYERKLASLGLSVPPERFVTSSQAVSRHIGGEAAGRSAFVIGEKGLISEMEAAGLNVVVSGDAPRVDFVIVGWDRGFTFEKLRSAVTYIRNGAQFIATNCDATYPTPDGLWPGAGSIVAAVSTGSGRQPFVAGKPNTLIVRLALERMGSIAGETLLVGDRLETDIRSGCEAGVDTLLVLTGVSRVEDIEHSGVRPTYTGRSLEALLDYGMLE